MDVLQEDALCVRMLDTVLRMVVLYDGCVGMGVVDWNTYTYVLCSYSLLLFLSRILMQNPVQHTRISITRTIIIACIYVLEMIAVDAKYIHHSTQCHNRR